MLLVLGACSTSKGCDGWISYFEQTATGEPVPFRTGDTVMATVWSNDCIHIEGHPVFYESVITGASQTECNLDSAVFLGPDPMFGFGMAGWGPTSAVNLRQGADAQGHFYDFPRETVRAVFHGPFATFYRWPTGAPFDSTIQWSVAISQDAGTCIFVNGPLEIKGVVTGKVTIGAAGTVRLLDDIKYADLLGNNWYYPDNQLATRYSVLGIVSESDVVIANTFENGRDNSGMPNGTWGREQTNRNLTDIVITAAIEVLNGSFTFEQQNDSASGHVSEFWPDDRGKVYIFGSVKQYRRGYLNRTNNIFTGYQLSLRADRRFQIRRPPCLSEWEGDLADSLDFSDVPVGSSVSDTVEVGLYCPTTFDSLPVPAPFAATVFPPFFGRFFHIQVQFTPLDTVSYADTLHGFYSPRMLILRGRGVPPSASDSSFILHPSSFLASPIRSMRGRRFASACHRRGKSP
jgi:hypothetical protein